MKHRQELAAASVSFFEIRLLLAFNMGIRVSKAQKKQDEESFIVPMLHHFQLPANKKIFYIHKVNAGYNKLMFQSFEPKHVKYPFLFPARPAVYPHNYFKLWFTNQRANARLSTQFVNRPQTTIYGVTQSYDVLVSQAVYL